MHHLFRYECFGIHFLATFSINFKAYTCFQLLSQRNSKPCTSVHSLVWSKDDQLEVANNFYYELWRWSWDGSTYMLQPYPPIIPYISGGSNWTIFIIRCLLYATTLFNRCLHFKVECIQHQYQSRKFGDHIGHGGVYNNYQWGLLVGQIIQWLQSIVLVPPVCIPLDCSNVALTICLEVTPSTRPYWMLRY